MITATIGGYEVKFDPQDAGKYDAARQCVYVYAQHKDRTYSASLKSLQDNEELTCPSSGPSSDRHLKVSSGDIHRIVEWVDFAFDLPLNPAQTEAVAQADAYLNNAVLPVYSSMDAALRNILASSVAGDQESLVNAIAEARQMYS